MNHRLTPYEEEQMIKTMVSKSDEQEPYILTNCEEESVVKTTVNRNDK